MITEKEIEQKANDALKSLEAKVDKLNDGSKQSKVIIWVIAAVIAVIIIYFKQH
jgi:hypothetical protein